MKKNKIISFKIKKIYKNKSKIIFKLKRMIKKFKFNNKHKINKIQI